MCRKYRSAALPSTHPTLPLPLSPSQTVRPPPSPPPPPPTRAYQPAYPLTHSIRPGREQGGGGGGGGGRHRQGAGEASRRQVGGCPVGRAGCRAPLSRLRRQRRAGPWPGSSHGLTPSVTGGWRSGRSLSLFQSERERGGGEKGRGRGKGEKEEEGRESRPSPSRRGRARCWGGLCGVARNGVWVCGWDT